MCTDLVARIEQVVNVTILGKMAFNEIRQWHVPMEDGKVGPISLSCPDASKILRNIQPFIDVCVESIDPELQAGWKKCAELFHATMDKLESKRIFDFEAVCDFQLVADEFSDYYISLTGRDGMTNYFHMISAGHFSYYLLDVKNLYKYSQQGWERVNGKAKRAFLHNTQRGGGIGGSSKLIPVLYIFCRELLWRFGFGDALFKEFEDIAMAYGKMTKQIEVDELAISAMADTILTLGNDNDIYGLREEDEEADFDFEIGSV